jgi:flagellar basal body rod protein FlgG
MCYDERRRGTSFALWVGTIFREVQVTVPAIVTTARTMSYYTRLQEVTANNLANASSEAFKADRLTARSFEQAVPEGVASIDFRQGVVRDTGRTFDLALERDGFFVVRTGAGERLTRGGGFAMDAAGFLVDRDGHPVLGLEGPIHVRGREVVIEPDGTVVVDEARADRLRIEVVDDLATLRKEGHGRFVAPAGTIAAPPGTTVRQGALEEANVDPLLGTVDLIMIQRAYSANVEALRAMDGVMSTVASDVGRVP